MLCQDSEREREEGGWREQQRHQNTPSNMSAAVRSLVNLQRVSGLRGLRAALSQQPAAVHSCPAALLGINKLPAGCHTITDSSSCRAQQVR